MKLSPGVCTLVEMLFPRNLETRYLAPLSITIIRAADEIIDYPFLVHYIPCSLGLLFSLNSRDN